MRSGRARKEKAVPKTRASYNNSVTFKGISLWSGMQLSERVIDTRLAGSYYLYTIVPFDISKDSDIVSSYELSSKDVINQ